MKSEFYDVVSTSAADYQPLDLSGSIEVVIKVHSAGRLTDEPFDGSNGIPLAPTDPPRVVHSTDDRLFFVSDAGTATAFVWVIRRRS